MILDPNDANDPLQLQPSAGQLGGPGATGALGASAPHIGICGFGVQAIEEARDPSITFVQMTQIRARLACPGCVQAFDLELKVKSTLATAVVEAPPMELQTRISAALSKIDLSQIDVTDL